LIDELVMGTIYVVLGCMSVPPAPSLDSSKALVVLADAGSNWISDVDPFSTIVNKLPEARLADPVELNETDVRSMASEILKFVILPSKSSGCPK
jgi:hypothetical protein